MLVLFATAFAKMAVRCVQYIIILRHLCNRTEAVEEKRHINNYSEFEWSSNFDLFFAFHGSVLAVKIYG